MLLTEELVALELELTELEAEELAELDVAELEALLEEELTLAPWSETACLKASTAVVASSPGQIEFKQLSMAAPFFSPLQATKFMESQSEPLLT